MDTKTIRALVLDVDGVLTDGKLYLGPEGEAMKVFCVHDGTAIKQWQAGGGKIAVLSGRRSAMVDARARELGVEAVVQGRDDKLAALGEVLNSWSLAPQQVCYVGDDLADIPAMDACGFAVAVANAVPEVKRHARYVTRLCGGEGAVREVVDYLLGHDGSEHS